MTSKRRWVQIAVRLRQYLDQFLGGALIDQQAVALTIKSHVDGVGDSSRYARRADPFLYGGDHNNVSKGRGRLTRFASLQDVEGVGRPRESQASRVCYTKFIGFQRPNLPDENGATLS